MRLESTTSGRGKRLDHFLKDRLPQYSRARIQQWIRQGLVLVDGRPGKSSYTLRGGEAIDVEPAPLPLLHAEPEDLPLDILYEDQDLIAVNKPAGVVVHAGAGRHSGTLVNALLHRFRNLSTVAGDLRPGIVHRLDRQTSGVLLVARTDFAHRRLAHQFASREVRKTYLALVHGNVRADAGKVEKPISRDPVRRTRMSVKSGRGREALTEYRVLERFEGFTLLEVRIATGRTHQIRVHMAAIGHPVAGDRLYGAPRSEPLTERFFLHAQQILFHSPSTGAEITLEAPLPEELKLWIERLKNRAGPI
ncbi:MAG: RluA family pseudouridine synthase [Bryobacteraceae bacterium]|nr:RluA family pseudouridine synthase [Bryobacterales bacterium]MEB2364077.1 RluA family pseudouridine synthase [Bryobacterales bacterium]NUN02245.1 RluA family pseudouridine synthase [Bryobacteraceae bacterium]